MLRAPKAPRHSQPTEPTRGQNSSHSHQTILSSAPPSPSSHPIPFSLVHRPSHPPIHHPPHHGITHISHSKTIMGQGPNSSPPPSSLPPSLPNLEPPPPPPARALVLCQKVTSTYLHVPTHCKMSCPCLSLSPRLYFLSPPPSTLYFFLVLDTLFTTYPVAA